MTNIEHIIRHPGEWAMDHTIDRLYFSIPILDGTVKEQLHALIIAARYVYHEVDIEEHRLK